MTLPRDKTTSATEDDQLESVANTESNPELCELELYSNNKELQDLCELTVVNKCQQQEIQVAQVEMETDEEDTFPDGQLNETGLWLVSMIISVGSKKWSM
ncbi:hypothetical protein H4S08_004664 [Coemansia sp. RSA 1365]|nr:hypothetical protein H4S08_004664 [Coemansia sp. RSA 1365]